MAKLISNLTRIAQGAPLKAKRARERTAEDIGNLAQQLAPYLTGELHDSKKVEHEENISYVGFTAEHAPHVEAGTSEMEAQPFLTPAFEINRENFKTNLIKELKEST